MLFITIISFVIDKELLISSIIFASVEASNSNPHLYFLTCEAKYVFADTIIGFLKKSAS